MIPALPSQTLVQLRAFGFQAMERYGHLGVTPQTLFESRVPHTMEGMRLDRYLSNRFRYFNREQWKTMVAEAKIAVNGSPQKRTYTVKMGDHVSFSGESVEEPPIPLSLDVVYEDNRIIAFSKQPHIPIHCCGKYLKNTMVELVRQKYNDPKVALQIKFLHRLDVETSGVLLGVKDPRVHHALYDQFENDLIQKTYLAIVFGVPTETQWTVDVPLGKAMGSKIQIKQWRNDAEGLESSTHFHLLGVSQDRRFSLIMAQPKTGRTNQIRAHAAYSGFPLVGDKTYYPDETIFIESQEQGYTDRVHQHVLFPRCLLHAWKLKCFVPEVGSDSTRPLEIRAPLPEDFRFALNAFAIHYEGDEEKRVHV